MNERSRIQNVAWGVALMALLGGPAVLGQSPAEGLQPTVRIVSPPGLSSAGFKLMPPSFDFAAEGIDPDAADGRPARCRFLLKEAIDAAGNPIRTPTEYLQHYAEVLSLDDPAWSEWSDYPADGEPARARFEDLTANSYYLIAFQVLDRDGTASSPFQYQVSVAHVRVLDGFFAPQVTLGETYLGFAVGTESFTEIAAGQPLNFSWVASAASYGGNIVSYRHGWDLVSVDDPNDPGWAVPPGLGPENLYAPQRSFNDGLHVFTLRVVDDTGGVRVMRWTLRVIPFVSPEYQLPLLVIDQTIDDNVNNWLDQSGVPRNREEYRNAWWQFLADGSGGVAGLNWDRDRFDQRQSATYSDLVKYRAVLCYAQANQAQMMFGQLRPAEGVDRYNWLAPYQERGGNFFLVGGGSMESVLEALPNYMVPIMFASPQETYVLDGQTYVVGFGDVALPDGSVVPRGPRMYPYATAGIAALDWTSPNTKYIYGRPYLARDDRTADCAGLKGLVLDPAFRSHHLIGPGAVADTMWTEALIDWHDVVDAAADTLRLLHDTFPFRNDEFVDANISSRPTPLLPQECAEGPDGFCVQPMYRGIARFDYVREYERAAGNADWPAGEYTPAELDDGCGPLALTGYEGVPQGSARTNGKTFGYFSYRNVADKPSGKADVYWGFDPYRFDHVQAKQAVRWVLDYFGLPINP